MVDHARVLAPAECCGLLAGHGQRAQCRYPMRNALASPTRYLADAGDLCAAFRQIRTSRLDLVAIYHSHPSSPAVPSRVDLEQNYYGPVPRIIISLTQEPPMVKAFRLFEDHFQELACVRS